MAEERTTDEERRHIIEGKMKRDIKFSFMVLYDDFFNALRVFSTARRRADIKRKKLKTLGKSKSTESEEECEEEEADEGKIQLLVVAEAIHMAWIPGMI